MRFASGRRVLPRSLLAVEGSGHATMTTTALVPGEDSIAAVFLGAPGFPSPASTALRQTSAATPVVAGRLFTG
jgi:hypothetical protein